MNSIKVNQVETQMQSEKKEWIKPELIDLDITSGPAQAFVESKLAYGS